MALKREVRLFLVLCDLLILISCSSQALCGEIFFWRDKEGVSHYSNVRPPASVSDVQTYTEKESNQRPDSEQETSEQPGIKDAKQKSVNTRTKQRKPDGSVSGNGTARYDGTGDTITFRVLKIYDGDSMKIEGGGMALMIRLLGIDAPESGGWKKGDSGSHGQPFSKEAKEALTRIVDHKDLHIKSYGTDRYNRLLAEVFTDDGTIANLELVREGMAEVYRGSPPEGFDITPYRQAEAEAKSRYRGIWSIGSSYQSPKVWRKQNPRK